MSQWIIQITNRDDVQTWEYGPMSMETALRRAESLEQELREIDFQTDLVVHAIPLQKWSWEERQGFVQAATEDRDHREGILDERFKEYQEGESVLS